jgi:hypothetical protein
MGGKSAPSAPDYTQAAEQMGKSGREVIEQQTWANRPTQLTPFGKSEWSSTPQWDPVTGQYLNKWTQSTQLTPDAQNALSSQLRLQRDRSRLGEQLTGRLQQDFANPADWGNLPAAGASVSAPEYGNLEDFRTRQENALYGRAASRLDPMWQQREEQQRTRLANMGLNIGDSPYSQAMADMGRDRNDAYNQAIFGAITGGGAEMANQIGMGGQIQGQQQGSSAYQNQLRQQAIAEMMQQRGMNLNEINAIMAGQQVALPGMPSFQGAGAAQPTNYLGAAQMTGQSALDKFNAEQAALQGMISGIGQIPGMFAGV